MAGNFQEFAKCKGCGARFSYMGTQEPPSCGSSACRFRRGPWGIGKRTRLSGATPAEWEGRARMARVREECGMPLDAIDREALERFPEPRSLFAQAFGVAADETA